MGSSSEPWIAKKAKDRIAALSTHLEDMPKDLVSGSEKLRVIAKNFYTDLRETWERTVEEIVLGGVVERFGSAVQTQRLREVALDDDDHRIIYFAMKKASELSGHDTASAKQIDYPDKKSMLADLQSLRAFCKQYNKKVIETSKRRKTQLEPPKAQVS